MEKYVGTFISNSKGFGFVSVEGLEQDLFIPEGDVNGAFLSDTVEVAVKPGREEEGQRREARVTKVLVRGITELVGTYESSRHYGFVVPDNKKIPEDIFIPIEVSGGAVTGDKVVVTLTSYGNPGRGSRPEGKVKEIIGNINDPGVDILSIVKGYDLPMEFPEKVMNQAARTPNEVLEADIAGRRDLRDTLMVTIDGEDTKDIDDAVSLTVDEEGLYHLGVHIADVANYVQENSALDREALRRGTSVYLVDRVIPMLPHKLSNGICSLNEGVDRLALSCLMTIDKTGEIIDHEIVESVICSNARMTYSSVQRIIVDKDPIEKKLYKDVAPMLRQMGKLAKILGKKRTKRGSIDFDFPEAKIILTPEGEPIDIKPYDHNEAMNLIEEFMLAANETVAKHFSDLGIPFVYRAHEEPDPMKIDKLYDFVLKFGYRFKPVRRDVEPKDIQKLLKKIKDTEEEGVITRLALRSMSQAKYSTESVGHFGLAATYYCHFTSPIRRYPDLQIHRIIKDVLRGRMNEERARHYAEILPEVAKHASETERTADEAERETDKLKKAQFMEQHVGETFEGTISGVTGFGLFVELPNTCEGFIPAAAMRRDYYIYDEANVCLVGEKTGEIFRLGQPVTVKVIDADRQARTVDFRLYDDVAGDFGYSANERGGRKGQKNGSAKLSRGKRDKDKSASVVGVQKEDASQDGQSSRGKSSRKSKKRTSKDTVPKPSGKKSSKKTAKSAKKKTKKLRIRQDGSVATWSGKSGKRSKKNNSQ